ncbi:MAG: hypothetical protein CUN55_16585, partial [Phototrophicales bacterium]
LEQVKTLIEKGDCTRARRALAYILRENRDNVEAWILLSYCALNQYEYDRCRKEILRRVPDHPDFQVRKVIEAPFDSNSESLANLGLMTQQMPAITPQQVQSNPKPTEPLKPNSRNRVLRLTIYLGVVSVLLIVLVLVGIYLNDLNSQNAIHATETRTVYEAAASTIYAQNTFTVSTVVARATQHVATEQSYIETQAAITITVNAQLGFIDEEGFVAQTDFTPEMPISVEFIPPIQTEAILIFQIADFNGQIIAEQS